MSLSRSCLESLASPVIFVRDSQGVILSFTSSHWLLDAFTAEERIRGVSYIANYRLMDVYLEICNHNNTIFQNKFISDLRSNQYLLFGHQDINCSNITTNNSPKTAERIIGIIITVIIIIIIIINIIIIIIIINNNIEAMASSFQGRHTGQLDPSY